MKLSEVMQGISYELITGELDPRVKEITNDSRAAQAGSLFIAIKGYQVDAHDLLPDVIERGCRIAVVENEAKITESLRSLAEDLVIVKVSSTLEAMAKIASNFYKQPSEKFTVVGITGTNGKTSIAQLLGGCLEANKQTTAVLGTTGNRICPRRSRRSRCPPRVLRRHRCVWQGCSLEPEEAVRTRAQPDLAADWAHVAAAAHRAGCRFCRGACHHRAQCPCADCPGPGPG